MVPTVMSSPNSAVTVLSGIEDVGIETTAPDSVVFVDLPMSTPAHSNPTWVDWED